MNSENVMTACYCVFTLNLDFYIYLLFILYFLISFVKFVVRTCNRRLVEQLRHHVVN